MTNLSELQVKLKQLSDAYAAQLPDKLKQLTSACNQLSQDVWDEAAFQATYRASHSLSGSGKTFGFSTLSTVARELENYLKPIGETKLFLTQEQYDHLHHLLNKLNQASSQRDYLHHKRVQQVNNH